MINFTVDILAFFIATHMVHIKTNIKRLVLSGLIGASFATVELFLDNRFLHIGLATLFLLIISLILCKSSSPIRKIKFLLAFYIAAFLISGAINFTYGILDRHIDSRLADISGTTNRKAIVFSLIILLIIGALRLFIMMFSSTVNEKSIKIRIELGKNSLDNDTFFWLDKFNFFLFFGNSNLSNCSSTLVAIILFNGSENFQHFRNWIR